MEVMHTDGKAYKYASDFRDEDSLRSAFNLLTQQVYGFDFEPWYSSGFWRDNYIPHSLFDGQRMISNISTSEIVFSVDGQKRTCVQIGTVMTDPEYRHKGLNRLLMDKVLARWRGKCDLIYLFANATVLDFYPKFGFKPVQEYQYSKSVTCSDKNNSFTKLDMADKRNQALVFSIANESCPVSRFSMQGNASLVMFWLIWIYANDVYYSDELDAVVVMQYQANKLLLMDVFCKQPVDLDELLPNLITPEVDSVVLGFTSQKASAGADGAFTAALLKPDDQLFVLDDRHGIADSQQFMFPLLSHA